jgi:hypothetical protein
MPVVINEFEVVDTAPTGTRRGEDAVPAAATPALPQPEDLRGVLVALAERELRRYGH